MAEDHRQRYSEPWAKFSALIVFVGFNLTFFPQFIAGYLGMPRRYHAYPPEFQVLNVLSTAGASILAVGYLIPIIYFTYSLVAGEKSADDPWGARGLEWEIPSPPPTENFTVYPDRHRGHAPVRAPEPGGRHCLTGHAEHFPGPIHQPPLVANVDAIQPHVHAEHAHHPQLQHHFDDMAQQAEASTLGMWVFLVTEIMFFGGLFMAYLVYRSSVAGGIPGGQPSSERRRGAPSTRAVLIFSSLTMALAVRAAQTEPAGADAGRLARPRRCSSAPAFLGIKAIEYTDKFTHHLVPGPHFHWEGQHPAAAEMFYSLYFCMTGLHALHMIIGLGIMTWLHRHGAGRRASTPTTTHRSRSPASTGTSSTSCGFSCSRCST